MPGTQVTIEAPEFSLYIATKFQVYQRLAERRTAPTTRHVSMPLLNARRVHRYLTMQASRSRDTRRLFTDFYDISPHFVRERMKELNHGTVLQACDPDAGGRSNYRWNEPISESTLHSFLKLQSLLAPKLCLALDVSRLYDKFGLEPFGRQAYLNTFRQLRERFVERKWYRLSSRTPSESPEFTHFLTRRLQDFLGLGLIRSDRDCFVLTPRAEEVATWFELFAYSAQYPRS